MAGCKRERQPEVPNVSSGVAPLVPTRRVLVRISSLTRSFGRQTYFAKRERELPRQNGSRSRDRDRVVQPHQVTIRNLEYCISNVVSCQSRKHEKPQVFHVAILPEQSYHTFNFGNDRAVMRKSIITQRDGGSRLESGCGGRRRAEKAKQGQTSRESARSPNRQTM